MGLGKVSLEVSDHNILSVKGIVSVWLQRLACIDTYGYEEKCTCKARVVKTSLKLQSLLYAGFTIEEQFHAGPVIDWGLKLMPSSKQKKIQKV